MFNLFGKKPEHPVATFFKDATTGQKMSLVNMLFISSGSDNGEPPTEQMNMLNSYVDILNVRSDQCMAQLQSGGRAKVVSDLRLLTKSQKEMLVWMVHEMLYLVRPVDKTRLSHSIDIFDEIGIDTDNYIEIVSKSAAIIKQFNG